MGKFITVLAAMLFLVGCGDEYLVTNHLPPTDDDISYEGVYFFEYGGVLELVESADGDITVIQGNQSLTSVNPEDDTFAHHPRIRGENLELHGDFLFLSRDENYSSSSHDVEEDESGANITGKRRTDYLFELLDDGGLKLTITIFSDRTNSNANYIHAVRVFTGL